MHDIPKDPRKIKERIKRYERTLKNDQSEYGFIRDGAGKRYLLGLLYLMINDTEGAYKSYKWFEETFPDDAGEPLCYFCWMLTLYRKGDLVSASNKLIQAMLQNLYLIPYLLKLNPERLDIWHGSNYADVEYLGYLPPVVLDLCTDTELAWIKEQYCSIKLKAIRELYIEIHRQLKTETHGPKRTQLVEQSSRLEHVDFSDLKF